MAASEMAQQGLLTNPKADPQRSAPAGVIADPASFPSKSGPKRNLKVVK
jgi:hypothetical protein